MGVGAEAVEAANAALVRLADDEMQVRPTRRRAAHAGRAVPCRA